jgi:hypothetical protein
MTRKNSNSTTGTSSQGPASFRTVALLRLPQACGILVCLAATPIHAAAGALSDLRVEKKHSDLPKTFYIQAQAENEKKTAPKQEPKTADNRITTFPNPYPQFLALQRELKEKKLSPNWAAVLGRHQKIGIEVSGKPNAEKDVKTCLLMGIRLADGVMSVMAKHGDSLRAAAEEIQSLAYSLGIDESVLPGIEGVRDAALKGDWAAVMSEVGFLQADIMAQLNGGGKLALESPKATIVALGAYLQAISYAGDVVGEHFADIDLTNYLRGGDYNRAIQSRLGELGDTYLDQVIIQKSSVLLQKIHAIVNIPVEGSIPEAKVLELTKLSQRFLAQIINTK